MGNTAAYGNRRFQREMHDESVKDADIATTAIGTAELEDSAVTTAKVEAELKTGQIIVQLGAGGGTHQITKPGHDITLTAMAIQASINGATSTTTAGLTVTLKEASAGGATTATVAAGALNGTTTAGSKVESFGSVLAASIPATVALYLVCGATTLMDDNCSAVIQYTVD